MVVLKVGGSVLKSQLPEGLIEDLKSVLQLQRAVVVHGGADLVTSFAERVGKPQKFVVSPDGMRSRYTDPETMEIFTMVMAGKINKTLVSRLSGRGVTAVGLAGADGRLLEAERKKRLVVVDERGRKRAIDGGYTGKITKVDAKILNLLLDAGFTPIVAPIAIDGESNLLNVDSDRAAAYVAGGLHADCVIFFTDVEGVILNRGVVRRLHFHEAQKNLDLIGHGMKKKVYAALESLHMGVKRAVIASAFNANPISAALAGEVGTTIVP